MSMLIKVFWKPLTVSVLFFMLLWGFSHARYEAGYRDADMAWQLKDEKRQQNDAVALANRQAQARQEEARRQDEAIKAVQQANSQLAAAHSDTADAMRSADKLHETISTLRRQLAASEAGKISAAASASAARANTLVLLTNVLESADQRAGELAAYADRARIAGKTCEKIYGSITQQEGQ